MNKYLLHLKKILYIVLFSSAVWFISFTIFPENQVIKIEVGETSPNSFTATRFLSVVRKKCLTNQCSYTHYCKKKK